MLLGQGFFILVGYFERINNFHIKRGKILFISCDQDIILCDACRSNQQIHNWHRFSDLLQLMGCFSPYDHHFGIDIDYFVFKPFKKMAVKPMRKLFLFRFTFGVFDTVFYFTDCDG